ncbi:uncharacterized protein Tco025E_07037 [Trypanosoma conorhini]|uniref:Uncharacterized protein n=1 Tax=Trypanosoma conorhini TaxID=83891 RepID=A0A422NUN2_9TRYP|nr:uncharacterized protein Tco025E_07037 [Trypanosoma conorhini]RNF09154.1 hypothetical protein Tco025E_07037 [Trypanosoma conorhini]
MSRLLKGASELALERLLHARLAAQLRWQREQLHRAQQAVVATPARAPPMAGVEQQLESFDRVVALAKEAARWIPAAAANAGPASPQQEQPESYIQDRVVECHDSCLRLRAEAAELVGVNDAARRAAQRRLEALEYQLAEWKLREEALVLAAVEPFQSAAVRASALPVPLPSAEALRQEGARLYAAASHTLHRGSRCGALLRLMQAHKDRASRGGGLQPLPFSPAEPLVVSSLQRTASPAAAAQRRMVLQFIKNEIQPLYDSNQISRVRFVDVVERVSRWFFATHPAPQPVLAANEKQSICQQIQATLTWQDEQRLRRRGA